jgi:signal transduction histidine kinase
MRAFNLKYFLYYSLTILILLLIIPAVIYLSEKADLPLSVRTSDGLILVEKTRTKSLLKKNDQIVEIDNISICSREDIEIIMDSRSVGETVLLKVRSGDEVRELPIQLIRFYSPLFIISQIGVGLYFILFGLFVFIKAKGNKTAELFHLASLGAAAIMIFTWSRYNPSFDFSYVTRIIFHIAYVLTPVFFIHFAFTFPIDRTAGFRWLITALYSFAVISAAFSIYSFLELTGSPDEKAVDYYRTVFNFDRYFLAAGVFISIATFIVSLIKAEERVQRQKLKWLITGFLIGPLSFIVLWVIPQSVADYALIPEELVSVLMMAVPATFTISILKYHLLDIDFIIKRSIIYSMLVAGIFFLYFLIVMSVSSFIKDVNMTLLSSLSAVLVAFLFNPLKNYVYNFVNKKFFRVQYNFREAVNSFFSEMKEIYDVQTLADKVITGINRFIPVEKAALIDISDISSLRVLSSHDIPESDLLFLQENVFYKYDLAKSIIFSEKVDSAAEPYESESSLKEVKINLILSAYQMEGKMQILLLVGNKKSDNRYSAEDIDLLQNVLNTASSALARIKLQEDLIRKEFEAEKLKELSRQRSLFVSTVSHDLKTPLTSIRMYSELIKMNTDSDKQKLASYAGYIEGESERLTRLVNNVLNFSSIENGIKEYCKKAIDLNAVLRQAICIMEYQLKVQGFIVISDIPEEKMITGADADALIEVFINLIGNAVKFSLSRKEIMIKSYSEDSSYIIEITDYGIGIGKQEQEKLFSPFFRSSGAQILKISGTGLGLSIVKHIVDAHNISVSVLSKLNEGTTFKLVIPKLAEEAYEEHLVN